MSHRHPSDFFVPPESKSSQWTLSDLESTVLTPYDAVFLAGSHTVGLDNDASDIDFYVVSMSSEDPDVFGRPTVAYTPDQRNSYDVDIFPLQAVLDTIHSVNSAHSPTAVKALDFDAMALYYRILSGHPVRKIDFISWLRSLASLDHVTSTYARWTSWQYRNATGLALLYDSLGDPLAATQFAGFAVTFCADSLAATSGFGYPGWKFAFDKLGRAIGENSEEYSLLWELKGPGKRTDDEYLAAICDLQGLLVDSNRDFDLWAGQLCFNGGAKVLRLRDRKMIRYHGVGAFDWTSKAGDPELLLSMHGKTLHALCQEIYANDRERCLQDLKGLLGSGVLAIAFE